jgi:cytochrome P450
LLWSWLAEHPEDRPSLGNTHFLRAAANEALRLHPTSLTLLRRATRPTVLTDGRSVGEGVYVAVDVMAANRDVSVFGRDAADFNPHRQRARNRPYGLTFGAGVHMCIGRELTTGSLTGSDTGGVGVIVRLLQELLDAGMELDPMNPPRLIPGTAQRKHASFPIILSRI